MARTSILTYGDTGCGKTPQFGELAKRGYLTLKKKSRLYTWDEGGTASIAPLIRRGIVEVIDCRNLAAPFDWLDEVARGNVLNPTTGKWIPDPGVADYFAIGFEGLTEAGDILMREMSDMSARGINIGGGGAFNFVNGTKKIGSNNQSHFGQAQSAISAAVKRSFRIPGEGFIVWTAAARRGEDQDNRVTILGPQIVGKALTSEVPRWFVYTFFLNKTDGDPMTGKGAEYRLYFHRHSDSTIPGASVLGNDRLPLGVTPLPEFITPSDLPKALDAIAAKAAEAERNLDAELARAEGAAVKGER